LGDGSQKKSYLHASDLVDAMLYIVEQTTLDRSPINIGPIDAGITVAEIAAKVTKRCSPTATINFGVSNRGWIGDVPKFIYSTARLGYLGWQTTITSHGAIDRAIDEIATQEGF
jgi:UDP-glucose 4-epimerase